MIAEIAQVRAGRKPQDLLVAGWEFFQGAVPKMFDFDGVHDE